MNPLNFIGSFLYNISPKGAICMACRASAIGIEGKQPQDNFLESLLATCKGMEDDLRLEMKKHRNYQ